MVTSTVFQGFNNVSEGVRMIESVLQDLQRKDLSDMLRKIQEYEKEKLQLVKFQNDC